MLKFESYQRNSPCVIVPCPIAAAFGSWVSILSTADIVLTMIDPLPPPPALISSLAQPLADALSLRTLPLHAHEVLLAFTTYHLMDTVLAPRLSRLLFPETYPPLPPRTKINWNIRVVSTFQAIVICALALWVVVADDERKNMNVEERIWGYTGALGLTQAFAAGYFLWDVKISAVNVGILGWGSLAHAVSALLITSLGFVRLSTVKYDSCGPEADIFRVASVRLPITTAWRSSYMPRRRLS